jgi:hypothetical protein
MEVGLSGKRSVPLKRKSRLKNPALKIPFKDSRLKIPLKEIRLNLLLLRNLGRIDAGHPRHALGRSRQRHSEAHHRR